MKNITLVPNEKCPLEVLTEMGKRITDSWIFIHENVFDRLRENCDEKRRSKNGDWQLYWYGEAVGILPPPRKVFLSVSEFSGPWRVISCIDAENIDYHTRSENPSEIIFLKME